MKINVIKMPGGVLMAASDMDAEQLNKFKSGGMFEIELKRPRNSSFHGKVFAFFQYCFSHWSSDNEYQDEKTQFDGFRKDMVILAGYYDTYTRMDGSVRVEAKSLSFGSMSQDDFESLYQALIQVAMDKIFKGSDEQVYNKLAGFF